MECVSKGFLNPGRTLVQMVASVMFYAHSLLCLAFVAFSAARLAGTDPLGAAGWVDMRDLEAGDEWAVQLAGYTVIALYLVFTEVYLYRMHLGV